MIFMCEKTDSSPKGESIPQLQGKGAVTVVKWLKKLLFDDSSVIEGSKQSFFTSNDITFYSVNLSEEPLRFLLTSIDYQ